MSEKDDFSVEVALDGLREKIEALDKAIREMSGRLESLMASLESIHLDEETLKC